jgi:hypothetical protein
MGLNDELKRLISSAPILKDYEEAYSDDGISKFLIRII